jgi:dCTP deaminase
MDNFAPDQVRGAGYDLRVGNHLRDSEGTLTRLSDGDVYALKPGEGAVVVTRESLTLPNDLAANVTLKTGVARTGLLLLSGLLVDPGWQRPLHLTILNIGSDEFALYPGRPIAAIQFLCLGEADEGPAPVSAIADRFFDESLPKQRPVAFLEKVNELGAEIGVLRREHDSLKRESDKLGVLASQVIPLAVLLVVATLFGVVVDVALSLLSNRKTVGTLHEAVPHTVSGTIVFSLCLVFGIAVALTAGLLPRRVLMTQGRYKVLAERIHHVERTPQQIDETKAQLDGLKAGLEAAMIELRELQNDWRESADVSSDDASYQ